MTYRVGRHLGRTIYRDDELIGIMDTPELGAMVVEALNLANRLIDHEADGYQGKRGAEGTSDTVPPEGSSYDPRSPWGDL